MLEICINEPEIESYFDHDKTKVLETLRFLAKNNIDFTQTIDTKQKEILLQREKSFFENPAKTKSWEEFKATV